jgi:hypothetical protein
LPQTRPPAPEADEEQNTARYLNRFSPPKVPFPLEFAFKSIPKLGAYHRAVVFQAFSKIAVYGVLAVCVFHF